MRRAGSRVAALAAVAVFVFAGCSGDDDDGGGDVTEAEYQEAANKICADGSDELEAAGEEASADLGADATAEDYANVIVNTALPLLREQIDDLKALELPNENGEAYTDLYNDLEDAVDNLEQMAKDDPEALLSLEEDPFADVGNRAAALGLADCGDGSSDSDSGDTTDSSADDQSTEGE
jgi:hypothetical protein